MANFKESTEQKEKETTVEDEPKSKAKKTEITEEEENAE